MNLKFVRATFLQIAAIVGAGIFSLPYLFYHSNFYLGVAGLIFLTLITIAIQYLYVEIILATKGDHQLSGYAAIYLNPRAKFLAALSLFLTGLAATIAYIKLGSRFLTLLIPTINPVPAIIIFILVACLFHLLRFRFFTVLSDYLPLFFIFIPLLLLYFVFSLPFPNGQWPVTSDFSLSFIGATIFALTGFTSLPEVEEILRGQKNKFRLLHLASIFGIAISCLIYLVFSFAVVKLSGPYLSADSVSGLFLASPSLGVILAFFGLLATFKATVNYLNIFKEIFYRDFSFSRPQAFVASLLIPLISLALLSVSFLEIISLAGSVTIFASVIIICLIRFRLPINWWHYFFIGIILATFTIGLIFEFLPL